MKYFFLIHGVISWLGYIAIAISSQFFNNPPLDRWANPALVGLCLLAFIGYELTCINEKLSRKDEEK